MKRSKLYVVVAILTTIFLFSFAALCNQCEVKPEEEKEGIEEAEAEEEEEEETDIGSEEEETEEAAEEETATEETEGEEEEEEGGEKTAPTIELEIYEGPTYSADDDVCYYRIKATVTGNPAPAIEFSKDDSLGAFGSKKAQVNLNDPSETYTLTATATNSEGTDTDSIELSWGCEVENQDPVISEITLMGNHYIGVQYEVSVAASDPDGDSLSYHWSVAGGTIEDSSANPIKWTTPNTAGNYDLTVIVDDGKGGTTTKTETVEVMPFLEVETTIGADESLSGYIEGYEVADACAWPTCCDVLVGDGSHNRYLKGYLTFDIRELSDLGVIAIKEVEIRIPGVTFLNKPWEAGSQMNIKVFDYGSLLDPGDFRCGGDTVKVFNTSSTLSDLTFSTSKLKDELKSYVSSGKELFQLKFGLNGRSSNGVADFYRIHENHAILYVKYETAD